MDGFLSQIIAAGVVLLVLAACLYGLRRKGAVALKPFGVVKNADIAVVSRKALTAQHALFLVEVRGRTLLIATSPRECHLLDTIESHGTGRS